jgi:dienelactone hydrolase
MHLHDQSEDRPLTTTMSCAACFTGTPQTATPKGTYTHLHGYKTYTATPCKPQPSGSVILYLPDFFSHKLPNNALLCDAYADLTGCTVIFPDIVMWGGVDPSWMPLFEVFYGTEPVSWWWKLVTAIRLLPMAPQFLLGMPDRAFPRVVEFARRLREGLDQEGKGGKLGVAGFCWGGFGATLLCKEMYKGRRLVDAAFTGHPSKLTTPRDVLEAVGSGVPYSVAVAEIDFMFDKEVAKVAEAALREKFGSTGKDGKVWELRVHEGAHHGFCVRAKEGVKADEQGRDAALQQAVEWFRTYLL